LTDTSKLTAWAEHRKKKKPLSFTRGGEGGAQADQAEKPVF
jgi:hypothetical protein